MKLTIKSFAAARVYFDDLFELESEGIRNIADLKLSLILYNPAAADFLKACRFAIGQEFVTDQQLLKAHELICIIPPSSGG